jgi:neutral ceramidase
MKAAWILGLALSPLSAAEAPLRAGVARIDITPPAGHAMGGYASRTAGATGTHDPLYATVLVLESGDTSLALVTCDLRSFVSTRVGEVAQSKFGITHTVISVSHTHSGPLTWEARTPWYTAAEDKMVQAIGEARQSLFPARIAAATGQIYLGFNRRKAAGGRAVMWWRNAEKLPSHPLDPALNVIRIQDQDQKTRAVLVNYACHPSVLGPDNLQYSADYPGAMKRYVESQTRGALCLFVQGGAGDINPYRDKEPVKNAGFQAVEEMGGELGRQVLRVLERARPVADSTLRLTSEILEVKNRWKPEERIPIGITAGVIGNAVCFLALPGEPFVEHQLTFRAKSECATPLLFGYSYSAGGVWAGYLPTIQAAVEGGYGADYNTTVAVGTGEMLIHRGIVQLFKLRGLLQDLPDARF